jgi:CotH kinase protein
MKTTDHFLWQQANGKWSMLPWDCDAFMASDKISNSIYNGEVNDPSNNFRGPNYIKDSFIKAFRNEFKERLNVLINTLLSPDNITALGYPTYSSFARSRNANVQRQIALGPFQRPTQPVNLFPPDGASALPPDALRASDYSHTTNPAPAHLSTTWEIRTADGSWSAPVFRTTSTNNLTSLPIPFERLTFGQTYAWRCTYTDTNGHPSLPSLATTFSYVGPRLEAVQISEGTVTFQFTALANHTYQIESCDDLGPSNWQVVQEVDADSIDRTLTVTNPVLPVRACFYRIRGL